MSANDLDLSDFIDRDEYDPIEHLNQLFPTEKSLERLDPFVGSVMDQIELLDVQISQAVQAQSEAGLQAVRDVIEAKQSITELFQKIRDIKAKAEQSEVMVQEICCDIRQLDHAKCHLQTTITGLKRLHMLVTAVDQLQEVTNRKQFKDAANLLDAVHQLLSYFKPYDSVPRIRELRNRVERVKKDLSSQVEASFQNVGQLGPTSGEVASISEPISNKIKGQYYHLHDACLVADALGQTLKKHLVSTFCRQQLSTYDLIFHSIEYGDMNPESLEKRFAWFRKLINAIDFHFEAVFPQHWQVQRRLCLNFLDKTREALLEELGRNEGDTAQEVKPLLKKLQKCLSFEKEASEKFEANLKNPKQANNKPTHSPILLPKDGEDANEDGEVLPLICGMLSSVFDPYMGPYIALEKKKLKEITSSDVSDSNEAIDQDGKLPVFSSSVNLFVYIKNSILRCTKLTNGTTFFDLYKEFKASLRDYAENLEDKFPPAASSTFYSKAPAYKVAEGKEIGICYVINTAEYCYSTLPQLEEIIRTKINASYREEIDMGQEEEIFKKLIAKAILILYKGLENRIEPSFKEMSAINWGECQPVGEESKYVHSIEENIAAFVPNVRNVLGKEYFRSFCNQFVSDFLPSFLNLILRQKLINDVGTQQLLLDVYNLKTILMRLPNIGKDQKSAERANEGESNVSNRILAGLISAHIGQIEIVLKLISLPKEKLAENFRVMCPDGMEMILVSIMNLKGMKKPEQVATLEKLGMNSSYLADEGIIAAFPSSENAQNIASKMESGMRSMTTGFQKFSFR